MGTHIENRDNPKTLEKTTRCKELSSSQTPKLAQCAMLEAALKRTKTLPERPWDAPRTLQDAQGRLLDSVWG